MSALLIGNARADITPIVPLPLEGMGNDYVRKENFVFPIEKRDMLFADILIFSDGDIQRAVLLCTMDTLFIHECFYVPAAREISKAINIPEKNIIFTASHTHSGVSMAKPDDDVKEHNARITSELVKAAKKALDDLSPAKISAGCTKVHGMNFQRRFIMQDGSHRCTIADKNFNADSIASYETTPENSLYAITVAREGKKDILIINWQAHPGFTPSFTKGVVSADYIGSLRAAAEEDENTHLVYIQGAAGNMEARTRFKKDEYYASNRALDREGYARELLRIVREDIGFKETTLGEIKLKSKTLTVRRKDGREVLEETNSLPLNVLTLGDIAFCTAPNELYSDSSIALRTASPYPYTIICTNSNGYYGYLPVLACFAGETYDKNPRGDSFGVRVSKCERGTAEKVVETLLGMMK